MHLSKEQRAECNKVIWMHLKIIALSASTPRLDEWPLPDVGVEWPLGLGVGVCSLGSSCLQGHSDIAGLGLGEGIPGRKTAFAEAHGRVWECRGYEYQLRSQIA